MAWTTCNHLKLLFHPGSKDSKLENHQLIIICRLRGCHDIFSLVTLWTAWQILSNSTRWKPSLKVSFFEIRHLWLEVREKPKCFSVEEWRNLDRVFFPPGRHVQPLNSQSSPFLSRLSTCGWSFFVIKVSGSAVFLPFKHHKNRWKQPALLGHFGMMLNLKPATKKGHV